MFVSRITLIKGLSNVAFNLASVWLSIVLISPGLAKIEPAKYFELLTINVLPAILSFVTGLFLLERIKRYEF